MTVSLKPVSQLSGEREAPSERLAIDDLELHFMDVNGVGVFGEVVYLPHFDGVRAGFSVIGSAQPIGTGSPEPSSVPRRAAIGPSKPGNVLAASLSETCRVMFAAPTVEMRAREVLGVRLWSLPDKRHHEEFHHLASGMGIRCGEVGHRHAASEWLIRPLVDEEDLSAIRQASEVDDDVGPFGRGHEELVELHRARQETAVGANLPEG